MNTHAGLPANLEFKAEAELALQRLLDLELLNRKNGKLVVWEKQFTTADKNITTSALRRHMRQILEKALYSLENDSIDRRNITAMTMAIDPARIPKAKEMIEDFTRKISKFLEGGKKSEVYEVNINLFPLQRTKKKELQMFRYLSFSLFLLPAIVFAEGGGVHGGDPVARNLNFVKTYIVSDILNTVTVNEMNSKGPLEIRSLYRTERRNNHPT